MVGGAAVLLKELISERAIDIIADAVELPNSSKVQAYVLSRKMLDKIVLLASRAQLPLEAIIPEDDVWGDTAGELGNFCCCNAARVGISASVLLLSTPLHSIVRFVA